jgi:multiple sugar transport system permease protein
VLAKGALLLLAATAFAPIWFLFNGSMLRSAKILFMPPKLFPTDPNLESYAWAFGLHGVPTWALNSLIVVVLTATASMVVSIMAGWAFSAYKFHGKQALWVILLSGLMIPRIALVIPLFVVTHKIGVSGTLASVILPCIFSPLGMFLARHFFDTIPRSLIESARMDGAHEMQILRHIVAPVSKPIITALTLFAAIGALQDWVWQALQLQRAEVVTLLVGWTRAIMSRSVGGNDVNPLGHAMAAGVLLFIPLLLLFVVANKYFTGSLEGAEKG